MVECTWLTSKIQRKLKFYLEVYFGDFIWRLTSTLMNFDTHVNAKTVSIRKSELGIRFLYISLSMLYKTEGFGNECSSLSHKKMPLALSVNSNRSLSEPVFCASISWSLASILSCDGNVFLRLM